MPSSQTRSSSASSTPGGGKAAKKTGFHSNRDQHGRFAPSSSLMGSPVTARTATTPSSLDLPAGIDDAEGEWRRIEKRLSFLEERVRDMEREKKDMERENKDMQEEVWRLRDRLEEETWTRRKVEEKLKKLEEGEESSERLENEVKKVINGELKKELKEAVREETKKEVERRKGNDGGVRRQGISSFLARTIFHYFIL